MVLESVVSHSYRSVLRRRLCALNGFLTAYGKMPPIIVTLGAMIIAKGLALIYTGGYPISGLPDSFAFWGREYLFGIQVPIILMVVLYLIFYIVLNHMPFWSLCLFPRR
ncbi:ribose ABC transporter permease protein RbsC [Klebsiella michiganensis]|uniref:Ribose ABC transporter permease protein RbsC n=1 Tax=Klebsiella michiganensis TaxID=1134687 RepID=A0A7H4N4I8_9ENTR|nr:ribose ABC transporter permease protein RbsC [Klebsiella michiganensis]